MNQNQIELSNVHNKLNVVESEAEDLLYAGDKLVPTKTRTFEASTYNSSWRRHHMEQFKENMALAIIEK